MFNFQIKQTKDFLKLTGGINRNIFNASEIKYLKQNVSNGQTMLFLRANLVLDISYRRMEGRKGLFQSLLFITLPFSISGTCII